jgi:lauroyl/myristoyl acyltransferase
MREETFLYSRRYARRRIVMHGQEHLLEAASNSGVMVNFLHYGSWILAGGAIAHHLGLPYTVIASRRNLELIAPEEKMFWEGVHQRGSQLYGHPLLYTDQSPRQSIKWLKTTGHILGVVLDVREQGQKYEEHPFQFLDHTLFMQSGPARLACIADVPMVPIAIQYRPQERRHHLYFEAPIFPDSDPQRMTQQVLQTLGKYLISVPEQQFYDIVTEFSRRVS